MHKMTRRRFIQGTTGVLAMHAAPVVATLRSTTPRQSAGPFYPVELPLDDDNDLTHVAGRNKKASGQITDLDGRILDQNGRPLGGFHIEIWQCDINGRYRHPHDPADRPIKAGIPGHRAYNQRQTSSLPIQNDPANTVLRTKKYIHVADLPHS